MIDRLADSSNLPLSSAVRAGNFIYLSGHVGYVGREASLEAEITDALQNLERSLERAGATRDQIVKANVFLDDLDYADVANTVYGDFFAGALPARTTVCVRLVPPYRYEIEAIAYV